ncbi:class I SAM-dependent methyltransferase [Mucilaginibacter jinjuensis]|uniref:Class I SAM-dependent methyltransferase n=1 Tax=Mucilaginibacter jinjuensis TaxID=1176721 RepID=A0ABY7T843_9SPHI|nr:class I SAM-dependent methyltransferase [Mucilaginibacter jinjuensis]WCT11392.1 class I SAM-dependent methyltransferase [Mucilaginibacter jinjuensis]
MQQTLSLSAEPTVRFSNRVGNYVKYRPGYPEAVLQSLQQEFNLNADSYIADIGSGTGIFTKLLLDKGYKVYAVEPNEPMKAFAESDLKGYKNFTSVAGTAEHTNLLANSIDLITSATAFHWFDVEKSRVEFKRVLKPNGAVVLLWNVRKADTDAFAIAYDKLLLKYSGDYKEVKDKTLNGERLAGFFDQGKFETISYPNEQVFDEEGLIGRSLSSSYVPLPETAEGKVFLNDLKAIFAEHQIDGKVRFLYDTVMYIGRV